MRLTPFWFLMVSLLVGSCGGDGGGISTEQTALEKAVTAAKSQEANVLALASTSPCSDSTQCKVLALEPTFNDPCNFTEVVLYSTLSTTAQQVVQAASEYAQLARQARALSAPLSFGTSCGGLTRLQLYVCVSSKCVVQ
jgi:multidrug efflux pump subunit AcrA (membrane-fusion protein)